MKRFQVNVNMEIKELFEKTYIGNINILSCNNIINKLIDEILLFEKKDILNIITYVKESIWDFKTIKSEIQMVYFLDCDKLNAIEKLSMETKMKKQDIVKNYMYFILLQNKKDDELIKIFNNKINIKCRLEGIIYNFPQEIEDIKLTEKDILIINTSLNKLRNKKPKLEKYYGKELIYNLMTNIYKFIYKTEFPLGDLDNYINKSRRTIQSWIKSLEWEINISKSHSRANRDYKVIRNKGKQTLLNNIAKGNITEDYVRQLFNIRLCEILKTYECIVGQNNISILDNGKEIDIPIVIINNNKFYKFGIEVNGDHWHKDTQRDVKKEIMIKNKGYKLYNIKLSENSKIQREEYGDISTQVMSICNDIQKLVS